MIRVAGQAEVVSFTNSDGLKDASFRIRGRPDLRRMGRMNDGRNQRRSGADGSVPVNAARLAHDPSRGEGTSHRMAALSRATVVNTKRNPGGGRCE